MSLLSAFSLRVASVVRLFVLSVLLVRRFPLVSLALANLPWPLSSSRRRCRSFCSAAFLFVVLSSPIK